MKDLAAYTMIFILFLAVGCVGSESLDTEQSIRPPLTFLESMCEQGEAGACEALADRLSNQEQFK
ncbi:hypothetical protein [Suttonella ornithocola]|uniref:Lipoprotein n=1 Tax=Suttonella ornithocola TaxID=279832 RepID=A0A380MT15_9GAMM|nr:hypothetical protein [Suttonella ornithocola]SUO95206.1 Uncharacterised protein [Suttonella ornithocola]SUQ09764.1 Uncharacterised protein [Suttonella ornithocola]